MIVRKRCRSTVDEGSKTPFLEAFSIWHFSFFRTGGLLGIVQLPGPATGKAFRDRSWLFIVPLRATRRRNEHLPFVVAFSIVPCCDFYALWLFPERPMVNSYQKMHQTSSLSHKRLQIQTPWTSDKSATTSQSEEPDHRLLHRPIWTLWCETDDGPAALLHLACTLWVSALVRDCWMKPCSPFVRRMLLLFSWEEVHFRRRPWLLFDPHLLLRHGLRRGRRRQGRRGLGLRERVWLGKWSG